MTDLWTATGEIIGAVWDDWGTSKNGPGSAPTLWIRGLADWIGVD